MTMEFIAQFKSSICGTQNSMLTDVFFFDRKIYSFKKHSNGNFSLEIISENEYTKLTGEFQDFINTRELRDKDCNLLNIWRANKVSNPNILPMRYYEDILQVYLSENIKSLKKIGEIAKGIDNLKKIFSEL